MIPATIIHLVENILVIERYIQTLMVCAILDQKFSVEDVDDEIDHHVGQQLLQQAGYI